MTLTAGTNNIIYFAKGTTGDEAYRGSITYNHASDYMNFRTGGFTERMRIDSAGKVGIGTTSPSKTLSVHSTTGSAGTPNGLYLYNEVHGSDSQIYMYAENDSGSNKGANIKLDPDAETFSLIGTGGQTAITIGDDGKVSTWQGTGMTSHFNVGNRDIDVGTSTGFANRQERIGLMAADPWGTAAGIYLSVSRNTNQDGRSHPSLHFTGNHGAGQSENYLIMSMNSNFYGRESVNIGSSANDANLEVNGHLTAIKQPAFSAGMTSNAGTGELTSFNIKTNIGSHFSSGRFTAPVAGSYFISFFGMSASSGTVDISCRINGTDTNQMVPYATATGGNHVHVSGSSVFDLSANDYVSMFNNNHTIYGPGSGRHGQFTGFLIG
jgi:hypothetical protein